MTKQKQKQKKHEDFKKVKLKVGKTKAAASNSTNTSFQSKTIVVPGQTISTNKGNEATTSRHLTLKELLGQLKHYHANTRRDALFGMRDLVTKHTALIVRHIGEILTATFPLLVDNDHDVRHALEVLFQVLLPNLTEEHVMPFMSLLQVYFGSALTHVFDDVRLDALDVLKVWLTHYPVPLARQTKKFLPLYINLLSGSDTHGSKLSTGVSKRMGSPKARASILASLCTLLDIGNLTDVTDFWFLGQSDLIAPKTTPSSDYEALSSVQLFDTSPMVHKILSLSEDTVSSNSQTNEGGTLKAEYDIEKLDDLQSFLEQIMPILLDCWLEYAPNLVSSQINSGTSNTQTPLSTLQQVVRVMNSLWRLFTRRVMLTRQYDRLGFAHKFAKDNFRHFIIYFPFGVDTAQRLSTETKHTMRIMSFEFAETISLLIPERAGDTKPHNTKVYSSSMLFSFVESVLDENTTQLADGLSNLMVLCWRLLRWAPWQDSSFQLLQKLMKAIERSHSQSLFKRCATQLLNHLFFLPMGGLDATPSCHSDARVWTLQREWLAGLPRLLWELGASEPSFSLMLLTMLKNVLKQQLSVSTPNVDPHSLASSLPASFVPFFHAIVPGQDQQFRHIRGPFASLPENVQRCAVELLFYLPALTPKLAQALMYSVLAARPSILIYTLNVVSLRLLQSKEFVGPSIEDTFSFLVTAVVGYTAFELQAMLSDAEQLQTATTLVVIPVEQSNNVRQALQKQTESSKKRKHEEENSNEHQPLLPFVSSTFWKFRVASIEIALGTLRRLENVDTSSAVLATLRSLLSSYKLMPIDAVVGLAKMSLLSDPSPSVDDISMLVTLVRALLGFVSHQSDAICLQTLTLMLTHFNALSEPFLMQLQLSFIEKTIVSALESTKLKDGLYILLQQPTISQLWQVHVNVLKQIKQVLMVDGNQSLVAELALQFPSLR